MSLSTLIENYYCRIVCNEIADHFTARVERRVKTVNELDHPGSCAINDSEELLGATTIHSSSSSFQNDKEQQPLSSPPKRFASVELREGIVELGSREKTRLDSAKKPISASERHSVEQPLLLENVNENDRAFDGLELNTTTFVEVLPTYKTGNKNIVSGELTLKSDSQIQQGLSSSSFDRDDPVSPSHEPPNLPSASDFEGSLKQAGSNYEQQDTATLHSEVHPTPSASLHLNDEAWEKSDRPDLSHVPDDESILSYYKSDYYDNETLEMETRQLLADLEERFETLILEMTEKHEKEIWRRLQFKDEFQRRTFGRVYRYFDPNRFSAPW